MSLQPVNDEQPGNRPGASRRVVAALVCAGLLIAAGSVTATYVLTKDSDDSAKAGGGSSAASAPETFTASGMFVLHGTGDEEYGWARQGGPCEGQGGYSDISEGSQVTIFNSANEPVAIGSLDAGSTVEDDAWYQCAFPFTVSDVPVGDSNIYTIEISHRGKVTFSRDDAAALAMSLGD